MDGFVFSKSTFLTPKIRNVLSLRRKSLCQTRYFLENSVTNAFPYQCIYWADLLIFPPEHVCVSLVESYGNFIFRVMREEIPILQPGLCFVSAVVRQKVLLCISPFCLSFWWL